MLGRTHEPPPLTPSVSARTFHYSADMRGLYLNGGLEQPNANWESPLESAGSTGLAAENGGKRYIRLLGQCGVIARKL